MGEISISLYKKVRSYRLHYTTGSLEHVYDLTAGNHRTHSKVDHFGFNRHQELLDVFVLSSKVNISVGVCGCDEEDESFGEEHKNG